MQEYRWKNTAIIYDLTYVFFDLAGSNLVYDFRLSNTVARPYDLPFIPDKVSDYGDLLIEASAHARGIIIIINLFFVCSCLKYFKLFQFVSLQSQ